jgi:hypothetical protein
MDQSPIGLDKAKKICLKYDNLGPMFCQKKTMHSEVSHGTFFFVRHSAKNSPQKKGGGGPLIHIARKKSRTRKHDFP